MFEDNDLALRTFITDLAYLNRNKINRKLFPNYNKDKNYEKEKINEKENSTTTKDNDKDIVQDHKLLNLLNVSHKTLIHLKLHQIEKQL